MSYVKKTWVTGEVVYAGPLNNIENGIANNDAAITGLTEELDTKANTDGYYQDMTVGNSEQLVSSVYVEDSEPYNFRTSGGSADIGNREYDEIVGVSVGWNQLVNTGATSVTVLSGHKYYAKVNGVETVSQSSGTAIPINDSSVDMVVDLTLALGSTIADYVYSLETATAGSGVAWLKRHFPKMFGSYRPYDTGSIQSVTGLSAHKMTGFNQYSGEGAENNKAFKWADGTLTNETNSVASGYIRVIPGTAYYTNYSAQVLWFDENKVYLGNPGNTGFKSFTIPSNVFYVRLGWRTSYNDSINMTAVSDINVNLSWDGSRNGEYEAYKEWNYPLDDSLTLRGILKLDANNSPYADGDINESDGTVTRRYGIVDLGTLTWKYISQRFKATLPNAEIPTNTSQVPNIRCLKFPTYPASTNFSSFDKAITLFLAQTDNLLIRDVDYTSPSAFQSAMSGVYLYYELATPTNETADKFTPIQYTGSTESFSTENDVPVGVDAKYYTDLTLPTLPTANGTYTLKCTVTDGTGIVSWVSE